jgi:2-furoate---CoA ligase
MDLSLMFQFAIERTPEKLAIVDGSNRLTYQQLGSRVKKIAFQLSKLGISKGDRVAICLETSEQNASAFFALQLLGAVAVPFNFRTKKEGIVYYIQDCEAKMFIFSDQIASLVEEVIEQLTICQYFINIGQIHHTQFIPFEQIVEKESALIDDYPSINGEDFSCILYTSGTTGEPKGIPLTHSQSLFRVMGHALNHGYINRNDEKVIGLMPLFHTVGMHAVFISAILFNHTYYPIAKFDPAQTLELMEKERITFLYGTPTHYQMLLNCEGFSLYDLSSIRHALYAGAPMSPNLAKQCAEKITPNLTLIYGNTETYNALFFRHTQDKPGIAVCGLFHRVRVVRIGGTPNDITPPNTEGELIIDMRSPEAFVSYLNKPGQTKQKVKEGWYYTGDACKMDQDGYYTITGRVDEMIISGGENIHPAEVESILLMHHRIKDVAVVGIQDETWGQIVKAYVVPKDSSLTITDLEQLLKESSLENYKRPRSIDFIDEIPRNPSGKILRTVLSQPVSQKG